MNLAKKGQFHFSFFIVDFQNQNFYEEYLIGGGSFINRA